MARAMGNARKANREAIRRFSVRVGEVMFGHLWLEGECKCATSVRERLAIPGREAA
jgi:hypothetical protein